MSQAIDGVTHYTDYRKNQGKVAVLEDWSGAYRWYLRGWLPIDRKAPILDAGCGEGHLLATLRRWGYEEARGIDCREEAVSFCRMNGLQAEQADVVQFLRRENRKFQVIFAIDVLEHMTLEQSLSFLQDAYGALLPGGSLIVQMPNLDSPFGGTVFFGDITHRTGFTSSSLPQLLRLAGFNEVEVRAAGPGIWGIKSVCRLALWQLIVFMIRAWNIVECGNPGTSILTRVMLARGLARAETHPLPQ